MIAVAAGAGGHAGPISPFALVQEIREWFKGPLLLSGCIATGDAILAAEAMGADLAYIGSAFIATDEANASEAYKRMIVESGADDIVYTNYFTGIHGNYLKPSIAAQGMDPNNLPVSDPSKMNFESGSSKPKSWKDIWGSGQGIGAVKAVMPAAALVDRLAQEYAAARNRLQLTSLRESCGIIGVNAMSEGLFEGLGPEARFNAYLAQGKFMIQRSRSTGKHRLLPAHDQSWHRRG